MVLRRGSLSPDDGSRIGSNSGEGESTLPILPPVTPLKESGRRLAQSSFDSDDPPDGVAN